MLDFIITVIFAVAGVEIVSHLTRLAKLRRETQRALIVHDVPLVSLLAGPALSSPLLLNRTSSWIVIVIWIIDQVWLSFTAMRNDPHMHPGSVAELIIESHTWLLDNVGALLTSLSTLASLSLNLWLLGEGLLLSLLLLLKLLTIIMKEPIIVNLIQLDLRLVFGEGHLLLGLKRLVL